MRVWRLVYRLVAIAVLITVLYFDTWTSTNVLMAQDQQWTIPQKLFQTQGRASEAEVVADPAGGVHVFWAYGQPGAEDAGAGQAIFYSAAQGDGWLEPRDVLVSPGDRIARNPAVAADHTGALHVVWSGGDALFYSRAFAPDASSPRAWRAPVAIAANASALEPGIAATRSRLFVVWTQALRGLMFSTSDDGGATWSDGKTIFPTGNNELARWGRIAAAPSGRLHVVFTRTLDDSTESYGRRDANLIYYLRSDDGGATWSEPLQMTPKPDYGEINVAVCADQTVHVAWNGRAGALGRYHRSSTDGGATWSETDEAVSPNSPFGDGGLTGFPALVCDDTGALHLVSTANAGNFYTRWRDGAWLPPALISGQVDGKGVSGQNHSLEQPSIALSRGNELRVVFHDGFQRIWHTSAVIDAPAKAPVPLSATPEAQRAATPTTAAGVVPLPTPPPPAALALPAGAPPASESATLPVALGVLPAALLIAAVAFVSIARRRR